MSGGVGGWTPLLKGNVGQVSQSLLDKNFRYFETSKSDKSDPPGLSARKISLTKTTLGVKPNKTVPNLISESESSCWMRALLSCMGSFPPLSNL